MLRQIFKQVSTTFKSAFAYQHQERFHPYKGEIFWKLNDSRTGALLGEGHLKNIVTIDASVLIARLMKSTSTANLSEPKFGALCLAVGTGDSGWNLQHPPASTNTQRSLFNEIGRKTFSATEYIDSNGSVSLIPTNVIDLTAVFGENEATGPITEMGVVGGDASSNMAVRSPILPANGAYDPTVNTVGKDMLINYVTFPVINKPSNSTLSWVWRFTF